MRRERSKTHPAGSVLRTDFRIKEHETDGYGLPGKLPDPTAEGMRSEASNRAVLALSASVSTFDASASCLLA